MAVGKAGWPGNTRCSALPTAGQPRGLLAAKQPGSRERWLGPTWRSATPCRVLKVMDRHGLVDAAGKIDWMRNWWRVWQVGAPAMAAPLVLPYYYSGCRQARHALHDVHHSVSCPPVTLMQGNLDNNCEEGEEGNCQIVVS